MMGQNDFVFCKNQMIYAVQYYLNDQMLGYNEKVEVTDIIATKEKETVSFTISTKAFKKEQA